jgi:nucleotide-binding universal stress UspA family protein
MASDGPRVVVGYDASAASMEALRTALREAKQRGAVLHVVTGYDDAWVGHGPQPPDWEERLRAQTKALQQEALYEITGGGDAGVEVTCSAVVGEPGKVLVDAARGAELVVVGNRGHNVLTQAILGSVSMHALRHATCCVTVVRPDPTRPHAHLPSAELAGRI